MVLLQSTAQGLCPLRSLMPARAIRESHEATRQPDSSSCGICFFLFCFCRKKKKTKKKKKQKNKKA